MPTSDRRPSTMNSHLPAEVTQNSMAGQQRLQTSELQCDELTTPSSFLYRKMRFKTRGSSCPDFTSEAMLWIKEVQMVDSVDESKSSRSVADENFHKLRTAGHENCFCFEQYRPEFPLQEEGQSGGTES